jgi:multidrug resistance efflux pump
MDMLLILSYAAICIAIFKIFKIPLNKWTVPTAILGGVGIVGALVLIMNYNHPFTPLAKRAFVTTPIVPTVKGRVINVPVTANQPLKHGDILFEIEPTTYVAEVSRLRAALAGAQTEDVKLDTSVETANSKMLQAEAQLKRTMSEYQRYKDAFDKGATSQQEVDVREKQVDVDQAAYDAAVSEDKRARQSSDADYAGDNPQVAEIRSQLTVAEFNLQETVVRAPTDGYVTQLALRPGMMAVPLPLRPVMTFVHDEEKFFIAAFRQNSLQRLKAGYEAEFLFKALPGKVFRGEVVEVLPAIGESEIQEQGSLRGTEFFLREGRTAVKLRLLDDMSEYHMPDGVSAEVAVYSDHFSHISIMRKILLRMKSWQNYLYLDH